MDNEAVDNHNMMHEAGWQVDCVAKWHGGSQSIWFSNGDDISLEYDAKNTSCMSIVRAHPKKS
eukprot:10335725-Ditylum_brightwellii.AAC.1